MCLYPWLGPLLLLLPTLSAEFLNEINLDGYDSRTDLEIIYLPKDLNVHRREIDDSIFYNFTAFQRSILLDLKPNTNLISRSAALVIDGEEVDNEDVGRSCHYLHVGEGRVASLDLCQESTHGLIVSEDDGEILEVYPLSPGVSPRTTEEEVRHVVRRTRLSRPPEQDSRRFDRKTPKGKRASLLTLEVAVFFDEAAYNIFAPYLKYDDKKMVDMILAYINGVQSLYHLPSLGASVDLTIVHLEIMKTQPRGMPHYDGERSKLLDSFCSYQQRKNPAGDSNPRHWDMALYISGLDFFAYENGKKSGVTMGLATVGGVCLEKYACIIAELGTTNVFGKPYPSAGFTSVYILAHEIGHNLGMHHDSSGNDCAKEGYIMSPSRGTNGETQWSACSAEVMTKLSLQPSTYAKCLMDRQKTGKQYDHSKFDDTPGQSYGAKRQCELLLRDQDALVAPSQKLQDICYNLQCKTPHRSGYYYAGPALEGTECGRAMWCQGGSCVKMTKKPNKVVVGSWSPWSAGDCDSGCIYKSKGHQNRRRLCDKDQGCRGTSFDKTLCDDSKVQINQQLVTEGKLMRNWKLESKRVTVETYASKKCKEFSALLPELDKEGVGLQAPHESVRPWMGCSIFCKRSDSRSYYTPRIELNDLKMSPYFPDGTWCHSDSTGNYYCLQNHCLPENFQFTKTSILDGIGEDIPISQNAYPDHRYPLEFLYPYLSLDEEGRPLQTSLPAGQVQPPRDEDWENQDYLDLPTPQP